MPRRVTQNRRVGRDFAGSLDCQAAGVAVCATSNAQQTCRCERFPRVKRRFVELAVIALGIGVFVLLYRGPGRGIVRGHVGDVAATMLVYGLIGLVWNARISVRAAVTMAIALAIEVGQTWWHVDSAAGSLLLGTTFDAWDVVAYAIGVVIAIGYDHLRVGAAASPAARASSGA